MASKLPRCCNVWAVALNFLNLDYYLDDVIFLFPSHDRDVSKLLHDVVNVGRFLDHYHHFNSESYFYLFMYSVMLILSLLKSESNPKST